MRITSKGQVTIPVEIRDKLGLRPNTEVEFEIVGNAVRMKKAREQKARTQIARAWIERIRGTAGPGMTTDEIMALTRGK